MPFGYFHGTILLAPAFSSLGERRHRIFPSIERHSEIEWLYTLLCRIQGYARSSSNHCFGYMVSVWTYWTLRVKPASKLRQLPKVVKVLTKLSHGAADLPLFMRIFILEKLKPLRWMWRKHPEIVNWLNAMKRRVRPIGQWANGKYQGLPNQYREISIPARCSGVTLDVAKLSDRHWILLFLSLFCLNDWRRRAVGFSLPGLYNYWLTPSLTEKNYDDFLENITTETKAIRQLPISFRNYYSRSKSSSRPSKNFKISRIINH
jgi:hypothetical protein